MRTAKTLIRLGAQSFCWFCHEAALFVPDLCHVCSLLILMRSTSESRVARGPRLKNKCLNLFIVTLIGNCLPRLITKRLAIYF